MATPTASSRIRVLIAEDNLDYLGVLVDVLEQYHNDVECLNKTAGNAEDAARLVAQEAPDVLLLDLRMPSRRGIDEKPARNGLAALRLITRCHPNTRVIVVSHITRNSHNYGLLYDIYQAGVSGYLTKDDEDERNLIEAIRRVIRGEAYYSSSVAPVFYGFKELTKREAEVFQLLTQGASNKDIIKELGIELGTVRTHVSKVLAKLDVVSREELRADKLR
jgi:DNA-binding NarL/FixJ family response regulator